MIFMRAGDSSDDDTLFSEHLMEYTPERAVIAVTPSYSGDAYSRRACDITLRRGDLGVTFEVYPAQDVNGNRVTSRCCGRPP